MKPRDFLFFVWKKRFLRKKLLTRLLFAFRFLLGGSARWRHWSAGVQTPVGKLFLIGGLEKTRTRWRELVSERGSYFILKNNLALFAKCYDGRDDQEEGSAHQWSEERPTIHWTSVTRTAVIQQQQSKAVTEKRRRKRTKNAEQLGCFFLNYLVVQWSVKLGCFLK